MREIRIEGTDAGQRFDKYLKKLLRDAPGSFLYRMLRKKNITLNGRKADGSERLAEGDEVKLFLSDETLERFTAVKRRGEEFTFLSSLVYPATAGTSRELPVVYEDGDILVINKPSGMLSQKAKPGDVSANEYILAYLIQKGELTETQMRAFRPSVCNRLDRNTSGLLLAGKTLKGLQESSEALRNRTAQKYYRCIVKGEIRETLHVRGWLVKDEAANRVSVCEKKPEGAARAQSIETEYRPVAGGGGYTELEVHLITGRSHQIRAHLAFLGHPVLGDAKYGDAKENARFRRACNVTSQLLHAYRMILADGREIVAPCGSEFERVREALNFSRNMR